MATFVFILFLLGLNVALSSATCQRPFVNKVSSEEASTIVNKHNQLRSDVAQGKVAKQPAASNLFDLKWDSALATAAQNIANTCIFKHVVVNDTRFYVGQNLGLSWSSAPSNGADWSGIIQSWFDEYKDFQYPTTSINGKTTGHYTQVVWANTKFVGCGYTYSFNNNRYEKLYVCNYGPGGNYKGEAPYKKA